MREIKTEGHGTYLAVINVGFEEKQDVPITLPARGAVTDAATDRPLKTSGGRVRLSLPPCGMVALHIR